VATRLETLEGVGLVNTLHSFLPEAQADRLAIFDQMRSDLETPVELADDESGEGLDQLTAVEVTIEGYGVALDLDAELRGDSDDDDPNVASAERIRRAAFALSERLRDEGDPLDLGALEEDLFGDLSALFDGVIP